MKSRSFSRSVSCDRRLVALLALTLLVLLPVIPASAASQRSARSAEDQPVSPNSVLGVAVEEQAARRGTAACLKVVRVLPGSEAAKNGIQPGDLITLLDGKPIGSADLFRASVQDHRGPTPLKIQFERGKKKILLSFSGSTSATGGRSARAEPGAPAVNSNRRGNADNARTLIRAAAAEARPNARRRGATATQIAAGETIDPWKIPGLPTQTPSGTGINVLKRIFLDPRSGELVFLGIHDATYATGPIDYTTLLHDALQSPSPSFSLEPTPATKAAVATFVRQLDQQMAANLSSDESGKAWFTRVIDLLLSDPALEVDRQRFFKRGAELFRIEPAEAPAFMLAMLNRTEIGSPRWVRFWVKLYEKLGAPEVGEYIRAAAAKDSDPYAFQASLDGLGLRPTIEHLQGQMAQGKMTDQRAYAMLEIEVWAQIYRRTRVPEARWLPAIERVRRGGSIDAFRSVMDGINTEVVTESAMLPWFNGLILSEAFLQRMHQMPVLETVSECREGLMPDSELARTFLAADWMLKTLSNTPELAERVPGHLTPSQFAFKRETARGVYDPGNIEMRFWLAPGVVPFHFDPSGGVLSFGEARTQIRAQLISHHGGTADEEQVTRSALAAYASEITRRYDKYARVLPELHQVREAAKILALVRWANARGQRLVPPGPAAPTRPLPHRFQRGFWTASFYANSEKFFFGLGASGGVDFGPSAGESWVQAQADPALGRTALQQLVGSAALGQQAADAALKGDLESARDLAGQSARAMTGEIDFSDHPALANIPEVPPPTRVDEIELQSEILVQSNEVISALSRAAQQERQASGDATALADIRAQRTGAEERLRQLKELSQQRSPEPAETKRWVALLRNGDWASLPKPALAAQPMPAPVATVEPQPATEPVQSATADSTEERDRIRGELTQLRSELCRIQSQLRRFNATIQLDQDQRDEWVRVTNEAYESALERAKEKLADFSVDFPEDKLSERLEQLTDPTERAKVKRALRMVQHLKEAYKVKDFSQWAAHEEYGRDEIIEGIGIVAEIFDVEGKIKDYLSKRWGLKRVIAFQEAASDLVTSAYDVTAEVLAWRRLNQLNRNSDSFLEATRKSGERIRAVIEGIHAREVRLGLDPGSTKMPCP